MKKMILFLSMATVFSCKIHNKKLIQDKVYPILISECPPDGNCKLEFIKNKSLKVTSDDGGYQSYELIENKTKSVVKFSYDRNKDTDYQDAGYAEEILFEISNSTNNMIKLKDKELKGANVLFGRHCFCKGHAGIFSVSEGQLEVIQKNNEIQFSLQFRSSNTPQVISTLSGKL